VTKLEQAARGTSRRRFLKYAALAGGVAAVTQLAGGLSGGPLADVWRALDPFQRNAVRLLSPKSAAATQLGHGLTGGLNLFWNGAATASRGLHLAASAGSPGATLELPTVSQAVTQDRLGVVIGVVGAQMAADLGAVVRASDTSLVVMDGGANVVRAGEDSPNVFYSTVGYWQSNWAMGAWAAQHLGQRAFLAASFYESGYDALYAAEAGIEAAQGQVAARHVNHGPGGPKPVKDAIDAIKRTQPDFVFAAYSGAEAVAFVQAYAAAGLQGEIPLVGSGFLVEESLLPEMGSAALGIHSALSWAPTLATPSNQSFAAAYTELTGSAPNVFAAVGYDTARWLSEALAAAGDGAQHPAAVREALRATRFVGPRGAWAINPATQQAQTPLYLRQTQVAAAGTVNQVMGELPAADEQDPRLEALRQAPRTGWLYAYPGV
jgi:branched-chain amino acid transport system substrate-binding protein